MSYDALVAKLHDDAGKWVGMVGVDYEHDKIFRSEQLSQANAVLIDHWKKGGLVTVNWSPQNPWLNDESDLTANQGTCDFAVIDVLQLMRAVTGEEDNVFNPAAGQVAVTFK